MGPDPRDWLPDGHLAESVRICALEGLVSLDLVAGDGTKLRADASMTANLTEEQIRAEIASSGPRSTPVLPVDPGHHRRPVRQRQLPPMTAAAGGGRGAAVLLRPAARKRQRPAGGRFKTKIDQSC
jgi:hypothetical protein